VSVHSILPGALTAVAERVLAAAGVPHVAHGDDAPASAAAAAADPAALALLGPYRSADVAEAVEATAPAGLPLLAPAATWVGVTRHDEPGGEDAARHRGTLLRLVARDTVLAQRLAADLRETARRAWVVSGRHAYGRQLRDQLTTAELPCAEHPGDADVVVLAGLTGGDEIAAAASLAPLPVIAFDGAQGAALGEREVRLVSPIAPQPGWSVADLHAGLALACRAAGLAAAAHARGDRAGVLAALREQGFDEHGDPLDPPVWLWRADRAWRLSPDRAL
jgi:hypothetical protein